ncbi:class I SAM-dependent methyltransferase [Reyranella sp.]|uniref:class I SAM-dependent methyltransferase n=1 Tax=Reyranella sp. TaxID=1929291 RepID=UPI0037831D17
MQLGAGYVTDVDYVHGYYRVLQPDLMNLACIWAGVRPPEVEAPNYLELGFGRGLSLNIHAAAAPGAYWGTDFNAGHGVEASVLAAASGAGIRLFDESFAELAERRDLPDFDYIVMHGVWSWLSPEDRDIVVDLLRRRLRPGGLFYVGYNCHSDWMASAPLQHLLGLHAELTGSQSADLKTSVESGLEFVRKIMNAKARFFDQNPAVSSLLEALRTQSPNLVAHAYFSRHHSPEGFADVSRILSAGNLSFAASVKLLDRFDDINIPPEGQRLLQEIGQPSLAETLRDYFMNQRVRGDVFVKGMHRLTPEERLEALLSLRVMLIAHLEDVPRSVRGAVRDLDLNESVHRNLLELLAADGHEPKPVRALVDAPGLRSLPRGPVVDALVALMGAGAVSTVRMPTESTRARCRALNRHFWNRSRTDGNIAWLASPVIGAGVSASRLEQLFTAAAATGRAQPEQQAAVAWHFLSAQGHRLTVAGRTLESPNENLTHLTEMAKVFNRKRLGILKTLEVL